MAAAGGGGRGSTAGRVHAALRRQPRGGWVGALARSPAAAAGARGLSLPAAARARLCGSPRLTPAGGPSGGPTVLEAFQRGLLRTLLRSVSSRLFLHRHGLPFDGRGDGLLRGLAPQIEAVAILHVVVDVVVLELQLASHCPRDGVAPTQGGISFIRQPLRGLRERGGGRGQRHKERQRQRQRERERERERERAGAHRWGERERARQRERENEREAERKRRGGRLTLPRPLCLCVVRAPTRLLRSLWPLCGGEQQGGGG